MSDVVVSRFCELNLFFKSIFFIIFPPFWFWFCLFCVEFVLPFFVPYRRFTSGTLAHLFRVNPRFPFVTASPAFAFSVHVKPPYLLIIHQSKIVRNRSVMRFVLFLSIRIQSIQCPSLDIRAVDFLVLRVRSNIQQPGTLAPPSITKYKIHRAGK